MHSASTYTEWGPLGGVLLTLQVSMNRFLFQGRAAALRPLSPPPSPQPEQQLPEFDRRLRSPPWPEVSHPNRGIEKTVLPTRGPTAWRTYSASGASEQDGPRLDRQKRLLCAERAATVSE